MGDWDGFAASPEIWRRDDDMTVGAAEGTVVSSIERVLDPNALTKIFALEDPGEPSLLAAMIDAFRDSANRHLAKLREALALADHATVLDESHAVSGAAACLGAEQVRALARHLEMRARQGSLSGAEAQLSGLETACAQALTALCEQRRIQLEEMIT